MQEDNEQKPRVFVSYSRRDKDFVARLVQGLNARGTLADYDQSEADPTYVSTGISAEDQWWLRLQELITAAHTIVFVVSPDSAKSRVCDEEIAFAQNLSKRIICVLRRPIDYATAPPRLSALNIKISFVDDDQRAFEESLGSLIFSIQRDVKWLRYGAQLTVAASQWFAATGHSADDYLLMGAELRPAEDWAARRPREEPELSELVLAYLEASREADAKRTTISMIEKARYLQLIGIMRPFLEEEVRIREATDLPLEFGGRRHAQVELRELKAIIENKQRWHPEPAIYEGTTSALDGYAGMYRFPCCGQRVVDIDFDEKYPPPQFRLDGCQVVPEPIIYGYDGTLRLSNYYLIESYHKLLKEKSA